MKTEQYIDSLIHISRTYSTYADLSFGLDKSKQMISKRGKNVITEGLNYWKAIQPMFRTATDTMGSLKANGNHEIGPQEVSHSQIPTSTKAGPEKSVNRSKQDTSYKH